MRTHTRITATTLLTAALALAAAGTAAADTNKNQQTSSISGPTLPLLSPNGGHHHGHPDNGQNSQQLTDKAHTTNWAVLDYVGAAGSHQEMGQKGGPNDREVEINEDNFGR
ncbi:hypothetical protein GCM10018785_11870 [Streptomyces longispororuber]|uniref:Uncharacterized protein n=1 Tax=Streptomyces longispororuber TaxID=68230 RepID=A0A918ZC19_9ACTN|nr:hypothetical protein [Streptomyces longispororuber]GHE43921.1 hypothetical protein GCM10018785_11870 [Streptomyces longispororuber]